MLSINKGADAAVALRRRHSVERQRGLTGTFRPVDLNDTSLRQTADAQRDIQTERTSRNALDFYGLSLAHAHNGAFTKGSFNLGKRCIQCFIFVHLIALNKAK